MYNEFTSSFKENYEYWKSQKLSDASAMGQVLHPANLRDSGIDLESPKMIDKVASAAVDLDPETAENWAKDIKELDWINPIPLVRLSRRIISSRNNQRRAR